MTALLRIPALRARMGDWVYYVCILKMSDVARRIKFASELFTSKMLSELVQQKLSHHAKDIEKHFLSQPQRFFNAVVVGTYGGNPQWYEIDVRAFDADSEVLPDYSEGVFGVLQLESSAEIWAIDGQHRVAGIRLAVQENPAFGDEELCVIFTTGVTSTHRSVDPEGFERTRRLFTTLNRHAKAVSKSDIVALDENDTIAIVTRALVEDYPLFQEKVSISQRKIPTSDKSSFTTIEVLYDVMDIILREKSINKWKEFKNIQRPDDAVIKFYHDKAVSFWNDMIDSSDALQAMHQADPKMQIAAKYRHQLGGHILFRPVGLLVVARSIKMLLDHGIAMRDAIQAIGKMPSQLTEFPWANLLWDSGNARMITTPENQRVAERILFHSAGGDLKSIRRDIEKLKKEYASIVDKDMQNIDFLRYI